MHKSFFREMFNRGQARQRKISEMQTLTEGLRGLGLGEDPAVKSFFGGTLSQYMETPKGKRHIDDLVKNPELLDHYLEVLKLPTAVERMMDFLKGGNGLNCFLDICDTKEGRMLLMRRGETKEGRDIGYAMVTSPSCWLPVIRIIKGMHDRHPMTDEKLPAPHSDLSNYRDSADWVSRLASLIRSPSMNEDVFISLCATRVNADLCKRMLDDDKEGRRAVFDYITGDRERTVRIFTRLFTSKKMRDVISGSLASRGGTKLLVELARDEIGRGILAELVVNANGMNVGWRSLLKGSLHKPTLMIRVGMAYFSEPVERPQIPENP